MSKKILRSFIKTYPIDSQNTSKIKKFSKLNRKIDKLNYRIIRLDSWHKYVEFDGQFYGFPHTAYGGTHRENDCGGNIKDGICLRCKEIL